MGLRPIPRQGNNRVSTKPTPSEKMKFHFFGLCRFSCAASRTGRKSEQNEKCFPNRKRFFSIFLLAACMPPLRILFFLIL